MSAGTPTVWYISKYLQLPDGAAPGGRGFELMRELSKRGTRCVILTSDSNHLTRVPTVRGSDLVEMRDGVEVYWLRTTKFEHAKSIKRILSWLHFEWKVLRLRKSRLPRPDTIVVSSLSLLSVLSGLVLRRRYGARLVFEVRDIWPLTLVAEGGFKDHNPLVWGLGVVERLGYRRSDLIVGTMPNLGEHVQKVVGEPLETACIPMGFAARTLGNQAPLPSDYLTEHVPRDRFLVGYAGTVGITNALEPLLAAAEQLSDDPRVHFLVVGEGGLLEEYKARTADQANISFAPRVPKESVQSVLEHCDLLFLSVHDSEVWRYGQSLNKLIDYMLSGKPVLAAYTGYESMLNEAECGTFVPAGDVAGIVREVRRYAAMDADERRVTGERGRSWLLEHRSYSQLAADFEPLLFPSS